MGFSKQSSRAPSPTAEHSSSSVKHVAFDAGLEQSFSADVWDRTSEPTRNLYQDVLELKETQHSLPRAIQPADQIGRSLPVYRRYRTSSPLLPESDSTPPRPKSPAASTFTFSSNSRRTVRTSAPSSLNPTTQSFTWHPSYLRICLRLVHRYTGPKGGSRSCRCWILSRLLPSCGHGQFGGIGKVMTPPTTVSDSETWKNHYDYRRPGFGYNPLAFNTDEQAIEHAAKKKKNVIVINDIEIELDDDGQVMTSLATTFSLLGLLQCPAPGTSYLRQPWLDIPLPSLPPLPHPPIPLDGQRRRQ
ncbi:hypothetical protein NP233_g3902 [Leucocoprinus birnbaumii]|uniref:Uncharacterized protein n=1 Tax=Leucocoprinus birnbaumii TaxID=56174 RepID=A0AAD5YW18_9AGAR|nr:hypothetical protein NP233_g3902 [Leucocoprinus birnbaumii]